MPKQSVRTKEKLTLLGNNGTVYSQDYDPEVLETFENKHPDHDYMVTFRCPEFTTLCPITGQPDFATLYINYVPNVRMVESKSLKLYLFSFRNHGDFHEDVTNIIRDDLVELMDPKYLEVRGMFYPRGGISIYPFANYAKPGSGYEQDRIPAHVLAAFRVSIRATAPARAGVPRCAGASSSFPGTRSEASSSSSNEVKPCRLTPAGRPPCSTAPTRAPSRWSPS